MTKKIEHQTFEHRRERLVQLRTSWARKSGRSDLTELIEVYADSFRHVDPDLARFWPSKVVPGNAPPKGELAAVEKTLKKLQSLLEGGLHVDALALVPDWDLIGLWFKVRDARSHLQRGIEAADGIPQGAPSTSGGQTGRYKNTYIDGVVHYVAIIYFALSGKKPASGSSVGKDGEKVHGPFPRFLREVLAIVGLPESKAQSRAKEVAKLYKTPKKRPLKSSSVPT